MHVVIPNDLDALGAYVTRFLALVGADRLLKRLAHFDAEQRRSFFQWKIVSDYHWLEMAIGFQCEVLAKEGRLKPDLTDELILAALNFAATTVEVYALLSPTGQQKLEGRLRDGLKAETGYAPLYLELSLAQRLMDADFDVTFADMEGTAQFDLLMRRGAFAAEIECKSLSADAGRQIHRKDFYRFMETISPALDARRTLGRSEVLVITFDGRLSPNTSDQAALVTATKSLLNDAPSIEFVGKGFELKIHDFNVALAGASTSDPKSLYKACSAIFGPNTHISGGLSKEGGCLVVMRSKREDDTSKPMLEAMRKAASQFSRKRPAFIAIQEHGIEAADLMLPRIRRQAGILSYALYSHYGASHVNAISISGFGAVVVREGSVAAPAFAIPNPKPTFPVQALDVPPFLLHMRDEDFAAAIGAPLPAPNKSFIPVDPSESYE